MPEQVLNILRVRATREQEGGARVAEIVPAYIWQARAPEQGLEKPVYDEVDPAYN